MKMKSNLCRFINNNLYNIGIISFIIVAGIIFIILNKYTNIEEFSPLSFEYNEKKTISRNKLQFLINDYESTDNCKQGYIQPTSYM